MTALPHSEFHLARMAGERQDRAAIRKALGLKRGAGWSLQSLGPHFLLDDEIYDVYCITNKNRTEAPDGLPWFVGCRREDNFVREFTREETQAMTKNKLSMAIID